jgi:hypothetical protein
LRIRPAGALAGILTIAALAPPLAQADPARVTVRVLGVSHSLVRTTVTTTTTAVTEDGHSCSGTSDGGALDRAVGHGDWAASWDTGFGALVLGSVFGETHPFGSGAYWSIYRNGVPTSGGICQSELAAGDDLLVYAACDTFTPVPGTACWGEPLTITSAPSTITAGRPFTVHVVESTTDQATFQTTVLPSAGATVTAGSATATTDAAGDATLVVADRGAISIKASKGNRAYDLRPACSTNGDDGKCGTSAPAPRRTAPSTRLAGIADRHRYAKGKGPRQLSGTVSASAGVLTVELRITRSDHGRCSYFSGNSLRFRPMRCGAEHGSWFRIGSAGSWRYLLPWRLPSGHYVIDVKAIDRAHNSDDKRRRGTNRAIITVA